MYNIENIVNIITVCDMMTHSNYTYYDEHLVMYMIAKSL